MLGPSSPDGRAVVLELALGKAVPPGDVRVDVTPTAVRVLVANRCAGLGSGPLTSTSSASPGAACSFLLLQLALPARVCPPEATAVRSRASGALVITMPKVDPGAALDPACLREEKGRGKEGARPPAAAAAAVVIAADAGDDAAPPLAG